MPRTIVVPCLTVLLLTVTMGCVSLNQESQTPRADRDRRTSHSSRTDTPTQSAENVFDPLPQQSDTRNLRVKPGDQLTLTVNGEAWGNGYKIPPSGNIDLRFIGSTRLSGLTLEEIRDKLYNRLHPDYLIDPEIRVNFEKVSEVRVLVMGQVGRPTHVKLRRNEGIMDALVEAGSLTRNSIRTKMYIFRKTGNDTAVYRADYERYAHGDLRQNVPLRNGDLVYVRTHFWPHFDRLQDILQTIGFTAGTATNVQRAEGPN